MLSKDLSNSLRKGRARYYQNTDKTQFWNKMSNSEQGSSKLPCSEIRLETSFLGFIKVFSFISKMTSRSTYVSKFNVWILRMTCLDCLKYGRKKHFEMAV